MLCLTCNCLLSENYDDQQIKASTLIRILPVVLYVTFTWTAMSTSRQNLVSFFTAQWLESGGPGGVGGAWVVVVAGVVVEVVVDVVVVFSVVVVSGAGDVVVVVVVVLVVVSGAVVVVVSGMTVVVPLLSGTATGTGSSAA